MKSTGYICSLTKTTVYCILYILSISLQMNYYDYKTDIFLNLIWDIQFT
jgi:hypothetical protein